MPSVKIVDADLILEIESDDRSIGTLLGLGCEIMDRRNATGDWSAPAEDVTEAPGV